MFEVAPPELVVVDELTIRRYRSSDVALLHDAIIESTEHLKPWMAWISFEPLSLPDRTRLLESWSRQWDNGEDFLMAVFVEDELVASTGLHPRGGLDVVEIGYWVRARNVKQAVATRVVKALTSIAFETWAHIDRVEIHIDANNMGSVRVAERSGFVLSGSEERAPQAPGESGRLLHWKKDRPADY
jgi:RimJ/RimL family protein N-acetyltransferase